jgi:hypothetical protein
MGTIKTSNQFLSDVGSGYIEISREYSGGDGTGRQITYRYRGSKDALRNASVSWVLAGGKYQITENGPYSEATVIYSGTNFDTNNPTSPPPADEEEPSTRYEFRTEYVDSSLFELPTVRAEAKRYTQTIAGKTEADYFSSIKNAADDPVNNKLEFNVERFPIGFQIFQLLSRGQTSFQTSRCSLTKISSYSARNGLPATPPIIAAIYSGTVLANINLFPTSVRAVMPRPPSRTELTPDGTAWAWLKTNDSTSLTVKTNQVERNETWTFAAWPLLVYPYDVDPSLLR